MTFPIREPISIIPFMEYIYVQGGDTLDLYTTAECNSYRRVRYKSFYSNSESAMINTLIPVSPPTNPLTGGVVSLLAIT